jgi:hypothetical protein
VLAVLAGTALLVTGAEVVAYAATGDSFVLGRVNKADRTSVLANTGDGPALELRTGAAPPLAVTSGRKVVRLHADRLDGRDASQLGTRSRLYDVPFVGTTQSFSAEVGGLRPGAHLVSYSVVAEMESAGSMPIACNVMYLDRSPFSTAVGYGVTRGSFSQAGASGVVTVREEPVRLTCFSSDDFTVAADESFASYIAFTRVDQLRHGDLELVDD